MTPALQPRAEAFTALCWDLFPKKVSEPQLSQSRGAVCLSDQQLLDAAARMPWAHKFQALMNGDAGAYCKADGTPDYSSADMALCCFLAWLTGRDKARMRRIFESSRLVRPKWTEREDYRDNTLENACERGKGEYDPALPWRVEIEKSERLMRCYETAGGRS